MCKDCAAKLSPWFSERRQSTKEEIAEQLADREENRKAVAAFHPTRSIGKYTRLLIDEDAKKFMVTSSSKLSEANPDVLDFSQVTGCDLEIDEDRRELMTKDEEGRSVSYDPPRYEYSYAFSVEAFVNHPYFDRMRWSISNGHVKTGETPMTGDLGLQAGALMSSGMNGQNFAFNGYLPVKPQQRKESLRKLERLSAQTGQTQIIIETPYRNDAMLADMLEVFKDTTRICVASDITLPTQFIRTRTAARWKKAPVTIGKRPCVFIISA